MRTPSTPLITLLVLFATPAAAEQRCALTLLHFNIQYVAGGCEGMAEELGLDTGDYDWSEEAMEDAIIVESFVPLLGMLERHPDWTVTFEMQGLMLEVLAERHPAELDRLRTLAKAGQAEIASLHFSDQLFLAYPKEDLARSIEINQAIFDELDMPLSGVVFTQEGQFGEGMLEVMAEYGYTIAVLPKNLYKVQHNDDPTGAFFEQSSVTVLVGSRSFTDEETGAAVQWTFLDDGELLATNDMPPYAGPLFVHSEAAVAEFEARSEERIADGYAMSGIEACVDGLLDDGVAPQPLPDILDGTWQPEDTADFGLWMGGAGVWDGDFGYESDNEILTLGTTAHMKVHVAQQVVDGATVVDLEGADVTVEEAWRELLLGQVSDSTGWNPYVTEVEYARDHLLRAEELATSAVAAVLPVSPGSTIWTDASGNPIVPPALDEPTDEPFRAAVSTDNNEREVTTTTLIDGRTGLQVLVVEFGPAESYRHFPEISFDWDGEAYRVVTALTETVEDHPVGDFTLDQFEMDEFGLSAPLGVVGLYPDVWLVADQQTVHLAAVFEIGGNRVTFRDETADPEDTATWRFLVARNAQAAVDAGVLLNDAGPVEFQFPGEGDPGDDDDDSAAQPDEGSGCDCRVGPATNASWTALILLVAAGVLRRDGSP